MKKESGRMANWTEILKEYQAISPIDNLRQKYISNLANYTKRNVIVYYSSFLHKPHDVELSITDRDMNAFMAVMQKLDADKGLDLVLHTPGGSLTAVEAIVSYIRGKFGTDVRAIVPQIAMSAGTMLSCSCKEIVMGEHSTLGPIDPLIGGISCQAVLDEFNLAVQRAKNDPASIPVWAAFVQKYPPGFLIECLNALNLSSEVVKEWLQTGMFYKNRKNKKIIADRIVSELNNHQKQKTHGRHITKSLCKKIGLKIVDLESDPNLQDAVLSVHHSFMINFSEKNNIVKIVENQLGARMIFNHI